MNLDRIDELLLEHFSKILGRKIRTVLDLGALSSKQILTLANELEDMILPSFVQMLKRSNGGRALFEKLMGNHEEENRELVDRFFERYMKMVMEPSDGEFNPLIAYLPVEYFDDIVFLESRKAFFLSQPMQVILEFIEFHFEEFPEWLPGEEEVAWQWFWDQVSGVDLNGT